MLKYADFIKWAKDDDKKKTTGERASEYGGAAAGAAAGGYGGYKGMTALFDKLDRGGNLDSLKDRFVRGEKLRGSVFENGIRARDYKPSMEIGSYRNLRDMLSRNKRGLYEHSMAVNWDGGLGKRLGDLAAPGHRPTGITPALNRSADRAQRMLEGSVSRTNPAATLPGLELNSRNLGEQIRGAGERLGRKMRIARNVAGAAGGTLGAVGGGVAGDAAGRLLGRLVFGG